MQKAVNQSFPETHEPGQADPVSPGEFGRQDDDVKVIERLDYLVSQVDQMQTALDELVRQRTIKEWYSTAEVAAILEKAEFTVRNYCRLGRIKGEKKASGRGKFQAWVISHAELLRVQREGLLPLVLA